jgi:hypothetical protein
MGITVALLAGLILSLGVVVLLWRATRRVMTFGDLKNFSVSRQWLIQHQGDDRSS